MAKLGENDYRYGARERLHESQILLRAQHFTGSVYLAGRAVEGMFRAVLWKLDSDYRTGRKTLSTGHDLRKLSLEIARIGADLDFRQTSPFASALERASRLWCNNMRYWPTTRLEKSWKSFGVIRRSFTIKKASIEFVTACQIVIKECELLWH